MPKIKFKQSTIFEKILREKKWPNQISVDNRLVGIGNTLNFAMEQTINPPIALYTGFSVQETLKEPFNL